MVKLHANRDFGSRLWKIKYGGNESGSAEFWIVTLYFNLGIGRQSHYYSKSWLWATGILLNLRIDNNNTRLNCMKMWSTLRYCIEWRIFIRSPLATLTRSPMEKRNFWWRFCIDVILIVIRHRFWLTNHLGDYSFELCSHQTTEESLL